MGFIDNFFGNNQVDGEQYKDWLLNGVDALEDHFKKNNQSALSNLEAFTSIGTYYTGALLIQLDKKISLEIKDVLCRVKGLYDCLWQLRLLKDNENQRVSKMYGMYQYRTENLISSLWEESPNAKSLFVPPFSDYYTSNFLVSDVESYIQSKEDPKDSIMICGGVIALECGISEKAVEIGGVIEEVLDLDRVNKYLKSFDIEKVIEMPDSFFE